MRTATAVPWVLVLSVLAGSGWLLRDFYPSELSFPFAGCLHFAFIALLAFGVGLRGGWEAIAPRTAVGVAVAGLCIFALPALVLDISAGRVPAFTSEALFCGIPVAVAIGAGVVGLNSGNRQPLLPGLIGLFGALLLFPVEPIATGRKAFSFFVVAACCLLVALASVKMRQVLRGVRIPQAVAIVASATALALGGYGLQAGWPRMSERVLQTEALRCLAFDLPFLWSTIWLSREIYPARLSARFLLAPFVSVLEGYALIREPVDNRQIAALLLMLAGAVLLLLKEEPEELPGLGLR